VGCPGAGSVADWQYTNPKKKDEMYSEERVPIDKVKERSKKMEERRGYKREVTPGGCREA